jgi:uncharacterized protein (TIGR01777 family)
MGKKILITGGTGLIGTRLSEILIDLGYDVAHLSRKPSKVTHYKAFRWNVKEGTLDDNAITYADYIVHLAGANLADGKWTDERKKEILDSRVQSSLLLYRKLKELPHHVKGFISSSAIGIYGNSGDRLVTEESVYGDDFLADVTKQGESAAWKVHELGIRTVLFRTGIVLSDKGGALPQIARPVKLMAGAPLGSGKQYMSWIHIDDLCRLYVEAIENTSFSGVYNAVAPNPVTNEEFTKTLAKVMGKPLVLPKVPAFGLKLMLGEVSEILLGGQRVSGNKVLHSGFTFEYATLDKALASFYNE